MGRRWIGLLTALAMAAALAVVLLPVTRCVRGHLEYERTAAEWKMQIAAVDEAETRKHWNLARWYNRNLTLENPEPGFQAAYASILDFGQGRMGLLEVPEWSLTLPITHGIGGAAGHDPASPLPIGGQGSQTVIWLNSEHPWTADMAVYIELPGQRRCYRVVSVQVMPIGWSIAAPMGQELLTLAHDSGNRRTIVRCVPWEGKLPVRQPSEVSLHRVVFWVVVLFFAASLLAAECFWKKSKQHRDFQRRVLRRLFVDSA